MVSKKKAIKYKRVFLLGKNIDILLFLALVFFFFLSCVIILNDSSPNSRWAKWRGMLLFAGSQTISIPRPIFGHSLISCIYANHSNSASFKIHIQVSKWKCLSSFKGFFLILEIFVLKTLLLWELLPVIREARSTNSLARGWRTPHIVFFIVFFWLNLCCLYTVQIDKLYHFYKICRHQMFIFVFVPPPVCFFLV